MTANSNVSHKEDFANEGLEPTTRLSTENSDPHSKTKVVGHENYHGIDTRALHMGADEVYEKKIAIMNEALMDLGMGSFQWKVFAITGFGWFVDNLWMQAIILIAPAVRAEFNVKRIAFLIVAKYAGLVVGSSVWHMTADFIGRRLAFNISLLLSSVAGLVAAGSPNFVAIATCCAFIGLGTGGNQPVDSAVFLEFVPATHQYLLTMQSAFWSVGQVVAALIGWPMIANYSCSANTPPGRCEYKDNLGWRYTYWTFGGLTLAMFLLRFLFKIPETPKRNGVETWLTISHLEAIDAQLAAQQTKRTEDSSTLARNTNTKSVLKRGLDKFAPRKISALFSTPRAALSMCLLLFLWCSIGMAYPLYNSFIPIYLQNKGVANGATSINETYRNYAIISVCGIPASILGGLTVDMKRIGRKGTGTLACLGTGIFLFLFTRAESKAGILGFSCAVAFFENLVYGLLYSYTPELFPTPIRGTANGLVAVFNRLSGLMAPIIAAYIGIDTDVPIWISAALFIVAGLVFFLLPYEMRGIAAS